MTQWKTLKEESTKNNHYNNNYNSSIVTHNYFFQIFSTYLSLANAINCKLRPVQSINTMPRTTWSELAVAVFNVDVDNPLSLPSSSCISFSFLAAFAFFVMVVGFLRLFKNQNSNAGQCSCKVVIERKVESS